MRWAPQATWTGDQICVLAGSAVPIVLYQQTADEFEVREVCHIHALMEGLLLEDQEPPVRAIRVVWFDGQFFRG